MSHNWTMLKISNQIEAPDVLASVRTDLWLRSILTEHGTEKWLPVMWKRSWIHILRRERLLIDWRYDGGRGGGRFAFFQGCIFYVEAITAQRNLSIRYEDNATTAVGGTFLHHQPAKMHLEFVNWILKYEGLIAAHNVWHYEFQVDLSVSEYLIDDF